MSERGRHELLGVLTARQRNALQRVAVPFLVAGGLNLLLGGRAAGLWLWATLYGLVQLREYAFNRGVLRRFPQAPTRVETGKILAQFVMGSLVFTGGAALLLDTRLELAPSLSVLVAAGTLLNGIVVSRTSLATFLALNSAPFAYLLAMPFVMAASDPTLVLAPALGMGAVLLCVSAALAWLTLSRSLRSEAAAKAELERRRAEAEAQVEARAAFTAAVSHELRTPLSAILAASCALEATHPGGVAGERIAMIADASRLMSRLLDDLLDLAKLEAGRMAVETHALDLRALMEETLRLWKPQAAAKGVVLEVEGLDSLPRWLDADGLRLRQVLNNLISNAVKFTDRGEVRLELSAFNSTDDIQRVRIAVVDTGVGLDDAALERLFVPFEQGSAAVARTHGGTGLGLAISRELARLMGGDLVAERRSDAAGARFTLTVPLTAATAPAALDASASTAPTAMAPRTARCVLAVDDHPLGRQAISVLLGMAGYEVRTCPDGPSALALLATGDEVDLVLTDLNMAGMDGLEFTRRLRVLPSPLAAVPVLAATGETGERVLARCLEAGMDGLVAKPLEPRALYAAVEAALAARGGGSAEESLEDSVASAFSSHSQTISTVQPAAASAA